MVGVRFRAEIGDKRMIQPPNILFFVSFFGILRRGKSFQKSIWGVMKMSESTVHTTIEDSKVYAP